MHLGLGTLFELASAIAVVALLAVPYGTALRRIGAAPLRNAALGTLFGITAAGAMLHPIALDDGVIFDMRALPIGLSGGFLGPVGALVSMAVAGATRTALGGAGMIAGLISIGIAGTAGTAWFYLARFMRPGLPFRLAVLSLLISLNFLAILLLPVEIAQKALVQLVPITLLLTLTGTLVVGGLLDRERCSMEREQALNEQIFKDPLTGIPNRRGFQRLVERTANRRRGAGTGSALLVMDLDHFKVINDTYGHEVGDLVLSELGARMEACLRGSDIVARFGGEEFVVFLPATSVEAAVVVAERLRNAVSDKPFAVAGETIPVTISVGAHWDANIVRCAAAFASADRALYAAKSRGRNRVVFDHWLEEEAPPAGVDPPACGPVESAAPAAPGALGAAA